jgi:hypothetical protein
MSRLGSRLLTASLALAVIAVFDGQSFASGPAIGQGGVRQAAGGFGAGGGVAGGGGGGGAVGAIGGGVGIVGGGGGGAIGRGGVVGGGFGAIGFGAVGGGAAFPFAGGMPMQGGGMGLLGMPMANPAMGGVRMGGGLVGGGFGAVGVGFGAVGGGFGGAGAPGVGGLVGAAGAARGQPTPRLTTPVAAPKQEMVDRDVVFEIASDATYSRLQSSATGLNNIEAKFADIKVGQRLSISAGKKGGPARPDDVTGTVVAVNEGNRQVTMKVSVPAEKPAGDLNYIAQNVMIRSQANSK